MDTIRIQIVNYKTKAYLLRCLETVFLDLKNSSSDSRLKYTVAILDNASGDDLSDILKTFPGQPIEIRQNEKNVGFGAGHNILAKAGNANYLLLLNPDIEVTEPHTIERLLHRAEASAAEVVGPRLVTDKGLTQWWDHGERYGFQAWIARHVGLSSWRERTEVVEAAWVSGAAFLIKKDLFDRLDGFDENFFLYVEEIDLCWRLRALGGRVIYDPTISMFHHGSVVAKKSEYQRASSEYFLQKHFRRRLDYPLLRLIHNIVN